MLIEIKGTCGRNIGLTMPQTQENFGLRPHQAAEITQQMMEEVVKDVCNDLTIQI